MSVTSILQVAPRPVVARPRRDWARINAAMEPCMLHPSPGTCPVGRVLIVESDAAAARPLHRTLELDAYCVEHVDDGDLAVELLRATPYDLVVCSDTVRGAHGLAMVRALRRFSDVPVALLANSGDLTIAINAIRAGANDLLLRPIAPDALLQSADRLVTAYRDRLDRQQEVVLAIGAHPDDVEIGVGGILAQHGRRGDRIIVLTLTGGASGGDWAQRRFESQCVADTLGAELILGNLEDTRVSEGTATIELIGRAIELHSPTTVYTHTAQDTHQDHRNSNRATLVAARQIPNVYCYQSPSSTIDFRPTRFVGIDDDVEAKLAMIGLFESQTDRDYLAPDVIRSTSRYWARYTRFQHVEPLEVVRECD